MINKFNTRTVETVIRSEIARDWGQGGVNRRGREDFQAVRLLCKVL